MQILQLPGRLEKHNLYIGFKDFKQNNPKINSEICIDFTKLNFAKPPGIVYLTILTDYLKQKNIQVSFKGTENNKEVIKYLDDSGFFEYTMGKKLDEINSRRETTSQLHVVKNECRHSWVDQNFIPWLSKVSEVNIPSFNEVSVCLKEIFNNINDHTDCVTGCAFGQWYPNKREIIFT